MKKINLKFLTVSKVNTDRCNFAFLRELFYFAGDSLFHKEHPFFILQLLEATIPVIQRYFLEFAYPDLALMKIQSVCGRGKVQAHEENADLAGTGRKCLRSDHWRGIGCDNLRRKVPIHGAHTTHDCTYFVA
jgi:hypothetical protein